MCEQNLLIGKKNWINQRIMPKSSLFYLKKERKKTKPKKKQKKKLPTFRKKKQTLSQKTLSQSLNLEN